MQLRINSDIGCLWSEQLKRRSELGVGVGKPAERSEGETNWSEEEQEAGWDIVIILLV